MNRPLWKNLLIGLCSAVGPDLHLPNFLWEVPAVQVSSGKATSAGTRYATQNALEEIRALPGSRTKALFSDFNSVRRMLRGSTDTQLRPRTPLRGFQPRAKWTRRAVGMNLSFLPAPNWLTSIGPVTCIWSLIFGREATFLLREDMKGRGHQAVRLTTGDVRTLLRRQNVRHAGINREGQTVAIKFRDVKPNPGASRDHGQHQ